MEAKSIKGKSLDEIREGFYQSLSGDFSPTMAIVFISISQDRNAIIKFFQNQGIDVIGATSSCEFIDDYQSKGEAAILLLDIPKEDYAIIFKQTGGKQLQKVVEEAANESISKIRKPAYILLTTFINEKEELFEGA